MRGQVDNAEYYKELGKNIRKIREQLNLLQKDVAVKLGITFQQYQKYEKGTNRIPTKALVIFCEMTNTDIKEITGCTAGDYEKVYKEAVVNYNTNNAVTNVYNSYNGFFSNLLNMDLTLMKNKIVVIAVATSLIIWSMFALLKAFPVLNAQYNVVFLSIQILAFLSAFAISLFAVFGYSLLTYGMTYVVYVGLYSLVVRFIEAYFTMPLPIVGFERVIMYGTALVLTFLTFFILKKCKVNISADFKKSKKEA